jgi:micrococcal nuclease
MYQYKCKVLKVIDGDTVDCSVDLGFRISIEMRFRLFGIDAPEMRTDAGKASRAKLLELMPVGSELIVNTNKDKQEKYGRYLGTFFDRDGNNVNVRMVMSGHAAVYGE